MKNTALKPVPLSRAEQMALTWGEVVNKTRAAEMLGISRRQVIRLVSSKQLKTAADGRVLVREAAEWIENGTPQMAKPKPRFKFVP